MVNGTEIDKINKYVERRMAVLLARRNMNHVVDIIFTDWMPLIFNGIKANSIVKGDARFKNIAAASILAKVTRDMLMDDYDKLYPQYDLKHNKGYGTKKHLEALDKYGPIEGFHRFSYGPVLEAYNKDLKLKV